MDEYKILADIYDIFNPKEDIFAQKPFFEKLIKEHSVARVLDCACGTGWHLSMFHDLGLACFGSDISTDMLSIAKTNLEGKYIPLKQQDFRDLGASWGDTYDMVTCLTNSLTHMLTDEDVIKALMSMYDRLNPGGIVVVTNDIADSLLDTKPKFTPARELANEAFYLVADYGKESEVVFNIIYVKKTDEGFDHRFATITYNAMRQSVLERCFAKTPFRNVAYYGDYDMNPYEKSSSPKLIAVAQK